MPRALLLLPYLYLFYTVYSYKTLTDLKKQYKKIENDRFSTSDVLVGKAMDFIYSNKTMMNLIARELWNVGSRAIDKIVEMKGKLLYEAYIEASWNFKQFLFLLCLC